MSGAVTILGQKVKHLFQIGFIFLMFNPLLVAQEKNYSFTAYLKNLQSIYLFDGVEDLTLENRLHNRLNFTFYPNNEVTMAFGLRNQAIYGGFPKFFNDLIEANRPLIEFINADPNTPNFPLSYGELLQPQQNLWNVAATLVDRRALVVNTHLDRFWLEIYEGKWQFRVGRQRINWGKNWVWNPNDLFNAYSYLDFDYEERPGSDAVKLSYFPNYTSEAELVINLNQNFEEESIIGARYAWNKWNYDFQVLTAWYKQQPTVGIGWAGNLKDAGFKGEMTYFFEKEQIDSTAGLVASLGLDYSFQNGLLVQTEVLYNQYGADNMGQNVLSNGFSGQALGPQNLWTHPWAAFVALSYPLTPLVQGSLVSIINLSDGSFFLTPSLSISVSDNIDFLILAQITDKQTLPFPLNKDFYGVVNSRLKWSF